MKPIWIVDDDQSIRFVLEKALAREQLPVRSFANPREVLAALADDEPQVLVSDIRMPGMDGIEVARLAADLVLRLSGVAPGQTVADIGAGEGYYSVRLAPRVGEKGRVLAQDINREALDRLAERFAAARALEPAEAEAALQQASLHLVTAILGDAPELVRETLKVM